MTPAVVKMGWDNAEAKAGAAELVNVSKHTKHQHDETWKEGGSKLKELFGVSELKGALLGAVGGGTVFGAVEALHGLVEEYAHLVDESKKFTNTDAESMQRLSLHAKLAGSDLGTVVGLASKLAVELEKVGEPKTDNALSALKLDAVELAGIGPERQLDLIATKLKEAEIAGRGGHSALKDLMGKGFAEGLPVLEAWAETAERIHNNPVVSDENAQKAKENIDRLIILGDKIKQDGLRMIDNLLHPGETAEGWRKFEEQKDQAERLAHGMKIPDAGSAASSGGSWLAGAQAALPSMRELAKLATEYNEKAEMTKRIGTADAERAAKVVAEGLKEACALQKQLSDDRTAAVLAELTTGERLEYNKQLLVEKEQEIQQLQGSGVFRQTDLLKLQIEREKIARQIGELAKEDNKEADEAIKKKRERQEALAKRLQHEHEALQKKKGSREEVDLEIMLMTAQVHHHTREADALEHEVRLRAEIAKLKAAGIEDENEQLRLAQRILGLQDKQAGKGAGAIHGYNWRNDPNHPLNKPHGLDWLTANGPGRFGPGGGGGNFFDGRFNNSPLDAWRARQGGNFFADHGLGPQTGQAARNGHVKPDHPVRIEQGRVEDLLRLAVEHLHLAVEHLQGLRND